MVKVRDEAAMAETQPLAAPSTTEPPSNSNGHNLHNSNNNTNANHNNNSHTTHGYIRKPHHRNHNNNNSHHSHHTHHFHHQTYHQYTYVHHHCTYSAAENAAPGAGDCSNGTNTPAKFYFGPGFEPQTATQQGGYGGGAPAGPSQCQNSNSSSEYVVLFHVNPGVTINFQVGDSLEVLRGPVTIPMVSTNSSPPIAMPVQVPRGHVVQQIVDENGTLRHVILSTQHPAGLMPMPSHNPQHYGAGPGNGATQPQQAYYQSLAAAAAAGFPPPPHYATSTIPPPPPGSHPIPSPTHMGHSPPPPTSQQQSYYNKDERTQRQYNKLKKKIHEKNKSVVDNTTNNNNNINIRRKDFVNGGLMKRTPPKEKDMNSVGTSEDGEESSIADEEDSVQLIADALSSVQAPKVSELSSRSALLQWAPPTRLSEPPTSSSIPGSNGSGGGGDSSTTSIPPTIPEIDITDIRYEVLLSDKSKEMKLFKSIYHGSSLSCRIRDLRPGQEYSVCLQAHYEEAQGAATDPIKFTTPACEPDQPQPPKLHQRLKDALHLRWSTVNDNGSHIVSYILEYDEGKGGDFVEFFKGRVKQHTLHKLQPATAYKFRLAAVNEVGRSPYSEVVVFTTCNNPPVKPDPPALVEANIDSLHLRWTCRPRDDEFTLQMCDSNTAKYFLPVYNGRDNQYVCTNLASFAEFKFRLRTENDGGKSPWSDEVSYWTLPDRPARPSKPVVKGRIHAHSFKLKWEPPGDTGGADITRYMLEVNSGSGYKLVYSGSDTEAVCDKLTPGTTYQLRVSCSSEGGQSNYSDPCTVTTEAIGPSQCPVPKVYGKPKANSITIRWSEPDYNGGAPVLEYEVEMTDLSACSSSTSASPATQPEDLSTASGTTTTTTTTTSNTTPIIVHKQKIRETECTMTDLLPGCDYRFTVRAVNRIGPGPWSELLTVRSGAAAPDPPHVPQVVCRSPFHAYVEWREPPCNGAPILEYRLEMSSPSNSSNSNNNSGSSTLNSERDVVDVGETVDDETPLDVVDQYFHLLYQGPELSHDVKGLSPFTTYYFRVQACNSAGYSSFSPKAATLTPAAPPSVVTMLRSESTPTTISLHWQEPSSNGAPIQHYNIELGDRTICTDGPVSEYLLENLQPDTTYKIKVQAVNAVGPGSLSSTLRTSTLRLPPPAPRLECIAVGHNHLKLKWGDGRNLDYTQYTVEMENIRSTNRDFQCVYKGTALTYKVNKLHELTTYRFRINATSDAGVGDFSPVYEFTTATAPPAALKQPKLVEVEQRSCTVEWFPAGSRNTFVDLIVYQVQVARLKEQNYRQVYRGPDTKCTIDNLDSGTEYTLRVLPIRICSTNESELAGPHSPILQFTTQPSDSTLSSLKLPNPSSGSSNRDSSTNSGLSLSHHSHHRGSHHKTSSAAGWSLIALLHSVELKTISQQPALYAILLVLFGLLLAYWLSMAVV